MGFAPHHKVLRDGALVRPFAVRVRAFGNLNRRAVRRVGVGVVRRCMVQTVRDGR